MAKAPPTVFSSPLLLTDEEILKLGITKDDAELFRRKQYQASFGISTWYDALKDHTFRTVHVPITFEEGKAFILMHEVQDNSLINNPVWKRPEEAIINQARDTLAKVEGRVAEAMKDFPDGVFVKLNTRSPKDVPVNDDDNPEIVSKVMAEMPPVGQRTQDAVCTAFVIGTNKYLHVTTAKQAMDLLLKSSRICEDLRKMVQFGEKFFDTCIVLREWLEEATARIAFEFRGFVYKNKLNALTQYFDFIYCEELHKNQALIADKIQQFYYSINSEIAHESYVIDFLVLRDKILIIELNPFHNGAGASLFSWAKDREQFLNGPFSFRIQTTPNPPQGNGILSKRWTKLIDSPPPIVQSEKEEATEEQGGGRNCIIA